MYQVVFTKDGWTVRGNGHAIHCPSLSAAITCAKRMNGN